MPETPFDLSASRVCVILNLGSGNKDDDAFAQSVRQGLAPHCADFALRPLPHDGDPVEMAQQAVRDGFDVIVAAGGDGTQSAVANALAGTDAVMAVLPGGTFNYFARDLGVGEDLDQAIDTIRTGRAVRIDIGQAENLVFLNNISLGAYPHVLKTRENIYKRWGRSRLVAYWSVLVALRRLRRPMTLTSRVKGRTRDDTTALVFIARSAYQLETFGLEGAEAIRAGQFAVLIARAQHPLRLAGSALRLALGLSAKNSDFDLVCTDELTIETPRRRVLVAHDGERTAMATPLHLKVWKGGLRVLVPPAGVDKTPDRLS